MAKPNRKILTTIIVVLFMASLIPVIWTTNAQTTLYDITVDNNLLKANEPVTIKYNITNYDNANSIEKVVIILGTNNPLNTTPVEVNATVYDDTGTLIGTWSYETTSEANGAANITLYTSNNPLQYGYTLVVELKFTTSSTGGVYDTSVSVYHWTPQATYELLTTETIQITVDAYAPEATLDLGYDGQYYYVRQDQNGDYILTFYLTDTYDGVNRLDPSTLQYSLEVYYNDTTQTQDTLLTEGTHYTVTTSTDTVNNVLTLTVTIISTAFTTTSPTDGHWFNISLTITDNVGHTTVYSGATGFNVTVDNTPPTVTFDGAYLVDTQTSVYSDGTNYYVTSGTTIYLVYTVTEDHLDVNSYVITSGGSPVTADSVTYSNGQFIVQLTINQDLPNGVTFTVSDYAGNTGSATSPAILVDNNAPTITVTADGTQLTPGFDFDNLYVSNSDITIYVNAQDTTPGSGLNSYSVNIDVASYLYDVWKGYAQWTTYNPTVNPDGSLTLSGDGVYRINVTATDNVGNTKKEVYYVVIDSQAPIVTVVVPPYTNSTILELTISLEDRTNVTVKISLDEAIVALRDYLSNSTVEDVFVIDLTELGLDDGEHVIVVEYTDLTGSNTGVQLFTFKLDRQAPYFNSSASDIDDLLFNQILDPFALTYPYELTIVLNDTVTGLDSTSVQILIDGYDNTSYASFTYDNTGLNLTVTLSLPDTVLQGLSSGEHTITIVFADYAGNQNSVTATFTIDKEAPTNGTITLYDQLSGEVISQYTTGYFNVTGTVTDDVSIASIIISVYNTTHRMNYIVVENANGVGSSVNLEDYSTATLDLRSVLVSGGTYNVDLIITDLYGHTTTVQIATITVDGDSPTMTYNNIDVSGQTYNIGCLQSINLVNIFIADAGVGVNWDTLSVTVDGQPWGDWSLNLDNGNLSIRLLGLDNGEHYVRVEVSDYAGNSVWTNITFTIDNEPPTVSGTAVSHKGGIGLEDLAFSDTVTQVEMFDITIEMDGQTFQFTGLNPSILDSVYYMMTPDYGGPIYSFEDFQTQLAYEYANMIQSGNNYPIIVIVHGEMYIITGVNSDDFTVNVTITAYDCARNTGSLELTNITVYAGEFLFTKLYNGWNLVSMPVMGTFTPEDIVNMVIGTGTVDSVYLYDKDTGEWYVYIPGVGYGQTGQFTVQDGNAFWIHYTTTEEDGGLMLVEGYLPYTAPPGGAPPTIVEYYLTPGGTFLGFTSAGPLIINEYLLPLTSQNAIYQYVYVFDARVQVWNMISATSTTTELYPGQGMWVIVYQDISFNVPIWYSYYQGAR